jgi:hypothetical protein
MEKPQFQKAKYLSKISIISRGDYRFFSYLGQQWCYPFVGGGTEKSRKVKKYES